jgi:hypothetical protein
MLQANMTITTNEFSVSFDTYWYGYPQSKIKVTWTEKGKPTKTFHVRVGYEDGYRVYFSKHELSKKLQCVFKHYYGVSKG